MIKIKKIAINIISIGSLILLSKYVPDENRIWYYITCAITGLFVSRIFKWMEKRDKDKKEMFNRYEIWFEGEKIGESDSFFKAMDIATEILETIKKHPKEPDEYMYLQIRCYHWIDRLFRIKNKSVPVIRYTIVVWSEKEQKFVINNH